VFCNELPELPDDSGGLARRFLIWRMRQQFLNEKADTELTDKLLAERAGILNLALDALDRLRARGRLIQHATGQQTAANMTDLSSNVRSFVEERCTIGTGEQVRVDTLFNHFRAWCEEKGVRHGSGSNAFSNKISASVPTVTSSRPSKDNPRRLTTLFGIGIRKSGSAQSKHKLPTLEEFHARDVTHA